MKLLLLIMEKSLHVIKNNLLKILDDKELTIEFSEKISKLPKIIKNLCIHEETKKIVLRFKKSKISTADIIKILIDSKFNFKEISTKDSDLEDIFIKLLKD